MTLELIQLFLHVPSSAHLSVGCSWTCTTIYFSATHKTHLPLATTTALCNVYSTELSLRPPKLPSSAKVSWFLLSPQGSRICYISPRRGNWSLPNSMEYQVFGTLQKLYLSSLYGQVLQKYILLDFYLSP